jgi:hypothetical protein
MKSPWPKDEELATWAHTMVLILVVAPFAGFLLWPGLRAITTGVLPPMSGPEFGQWVFGNRELLGGDAVLAGSALCGLGFATLAVAAGYSRWAVRVRLLRALGWVLMACALAFYAYAMRAVQP